MPRNITPRSRRQTSQKNWQKFGWLRTYPLQYLRFQPRGTSNPKKDCEASTLHRLILVMRLGWNLLITLILLTLIQTTEESLGTLYDCTSSTSEEILTYPKLQTYEHTVDHSITHSKAEIYRYSPKVTHLKIGEFKTSLEFTQGLIDDKIKDMDKALNEKIEEIEQTNEQQRVTKGKIYVEKQTELKHKIRTLEDRNRRNNLRIDGIGETEGENSEEIEDKVQRLFKNRLIITKDIDIERIHRMGPYTAQDDARPRTIIFKLLNYKDKLLILKNANRLKDTNIYINEDFSDATNEIRKELRVQMKKDREDGKFSRIVYDRLITREVKEENTGEN